jgi:hypothetical protein
MYLLDIKECCETMDIIPSGSEKIHQHLNILLLMDFTTGKGRTVSGL